MDPFTGPARDRRAKADAPTPDPFIDHYFSRLEPEVAASFTQQQRDAIKVMFGARGVARHMLELRRSIPFGRRRFYFVLLLGPERRTFPRLYSQGLISRPFTALFYAGIGGLLMLPVLFLLYWNSPWSL